MNSVSVPIYVESRYKINRKKIKEVIIRVLSEQAVTGPVEVSVAIIGNRKMRGLNKKYRGIDASTNVLSFSQTEGDVTLQPPDKLYLGDIVLAYPKVVEECARDNMLIDDRVNELVEHSLMHLLGQHHR
jgi:probable rRNA maturation factor